MRRSLSYLGALLMANMRFYKNDRRRLFVMSFFMMCQNALFFSLWIIIFDAMGTLKGWNLSDMARMYGVVAGAIGGSMFFFNGARTIVYRIKDGSLDTFLSRPRAALPSLLTSSSSLASLGDLLYAPLIWVVLGQVGWSDAPLLLLVTALSCVLFTAMTVIVYSLGFWFKGDSRLAEQLFMVLIIGTCNIIHGQPFMVRLAFMTILPAWFISYLPTELLRNFDPALLALLFGAAVFYSFVAALVFQAGVRRYKRSLCA